MFTLAPGSPHKYPKSPHSSLPMYGDEPRDRRCLQVAGNSPHFAASTEKMATTDSVSVFAEGTFEDQVRVSFSCASSFT